MPPSLEDFITREKLRPGDRLPPERDLCLQMGISRAALRKLLSEMESRGQLYRHVGRGTFVGDGPNVAEAPTALPGRNRALATYPAEILEARLILEPQVAAMAAHRASPHDIGELERAVARGWAAQSIADFELWDAAFHQTIVAASRNNLIIALYEHIAAVRAGKIWGRLKQQSLTGEKMRVFQQHHADIAAAIADRDPARAEAEMRRHVAMARDNMLGEATHAPSPFGRGLG